MSERPGPRTTGVASGVLAAVLALAAPDVSAAAGETRFDWCAPIAVRPERRVSDRRTCTPLWSAETLVEARLLLVGTGADATEPEVLHDPSPCAPPDDHESLGRFVREIRTAAARAERPAPRIVHLHRFELVKEGLASRPDFRSAYLLRTSRPFDDVLRFFARDRSAPCREGGCRFSPAFGGREDRNVGQWLRDLVDAAGEPGDHRRVVYYLARPSAGDRVYWPVGVVADLGQPAYRAFRVAAARRALEAGGYDAVMLNHKLHQYADRQGHWIGSARFPDVASMKGDTIWSGPPEGYGFPEYVAGWAALATDLRRAEVPYGVVAPHTLTGMDDARSPRDEAAAVEEVLRGAAVLLVPTQRRGDLARLAKARRAEGALVLEYDLSCSRLGKPD